jgi:hypothetical protein
MVAKVAGVGAGALAAAMFFAPGALADPDTPAPPPPDTIDQAAAPAAQAPVPHLYSPENLPPGTSDAPVGEPQGPGTTYAHEIWHSIQTQDITWRDGLLMLLAQRPMNPNATPPPGVAAGPQQQGPAVPPPPPPPTPEP